MAIVAGDIIVGPGKLRIAPLNTDDSLIVAGASPVWAPAWVDAGLTDDGLNLAIEKSYANHSVDQSPDWVASTITERHASIATNLVTTTLENLKSALNGGTITTGANWKKFEPNSDVIAVPETYVMLAIEGNNQSGKKVIVVVRRCLSVDNVSMPFKKDAKTMFSVSWAGHFVSDTTAPFVVYTQN